MNTGRGAAAAGYFIKGHSKYDLDQIDGGAEAYLRNRRRIASGAPDQLTNVCISN
jgi:hypothetical protein